MIKYIEKGFGLHTAINDSGYTLEPNTNDKAYDLAGNQSPAIDTAVQAIIDSYDPLPEAKVEAIDRINIAAGNTRTKYVTNIPSQDATYQLKLQDAQAFIAASYPEVSLANYPFINAEASAMSSTGQVAADLIVATFNSWTHLAAAIEGERRTAIEQVKAETNWQQCSAIADISEITLGAM